MVLVPIMKQEGTIQEPAFTVEQLICWKLNIMTSFPSQFQMGNIILEFILFYRQLLISIIIYFINRKKCEFFIELECFFLL